MKKVFSTLAHQHPFEKDLTHLESATNFTDAEDAYNSYNIQVGIQPISYFDSSKLEDEKLIQRTSSLSTLKQTTKNITFEFFGKSFTVDFSDKIQTEETLQKWINQNKIKGMKKIQIKMVVFSELSKKNKEFNDSLESLMQPYANAKIKKIQEDQKKISSKCPRNQDFT